MRKKSPSKLTWRVGEKPTGRYKSFQKRSWPSAEYPDGKPAITLHQVDGDSYFPGLSEALTLEIRIADYWENGFRWMTLKRRVVGVKQAKLVAQEFVDKHYEVLRDNTRSIIDVQRTTKA